MPRGTGPLADARYLSQLSLNAASVPPSPPPERPDAATHSSSGHVDSVPRDTHMPYINRSSTGFEVRATGEPGRGGSVYVGQIGSIAYMENESIGQYGSMPYVNQLSSMAAKEVTSYADRVEQLNSTRLPLPTTLRPVGAVGRGSLESLSSVRDTRSGSDSTAPGAHLKTLSNAGRVRRGCTSSMSTCGLTGGLHGNWQSVLSEQCSSMQSILNDENEQVLAQATVQAVTGLANALRTYAHRIESMRDEKKRLMRMASSMGRFSTVAKEQQRKTSEKQRPRSDDKTWSTKSAPPATSSAETGREWRRHTVHSPQRTKQVDAEMQTDPVAPISRTSGAAAGSQRIDQADNANDQRRLPSLRIPPRPSQVPALTTVEEGANYESSADDARSSYQHEGSAAARNSVSSDWATDSVQDEETEGRNSSLAVAPRVSSGIRASSPASLRDASSTEASRPGSQAPPLSARSCGAMSVRFNSNIRLTAGSEGEPSSRGDDLEEEGVPETLVNREPSQAPFNHELSQYRVMGPMDTTSTARSEWGQAGRTTVLRPRSYIIAGATSASRDVSVTGMSSVPSSSTAAMAVQRARSQTHDSTMPESSYSVVEKSRNSGSIISDRSIGSLDTKTVVGDPERDSINEDERPAVNQVMSNWEDGQNWDPEDLAEQTGNTEHRRLTQRRTNVLDQIKGGDNVDAARKGLERGASINLRSKSGTFATFEIKLKQCWEQDTSDYESQTYNTDKSIRQALLGLIDNSEEIIYDLTSRFQSFVVLPYSKKRFFWMLPGAVLIVYDLVYIPMQVFENSSTPFTLAIAWLAVCYWSMDIPFSFLTGFYRRREGRIEMRLGHIARAYITTWLPIDLVTILPDWLGIILESSPEGQEGAQSATLARLSKTLRIIRILRSVRLLRLAKLQHFAKDIKDRINSEYVFSFLQVCVLLLVLICVSHFMACAFYGIGRHNDGGWVNTQEYKNESLHYMYMTSLHWSLAQFQGNMEVHPKIFEERVFAVLVLIIGLVGISSLLSSITNMMMELQNYKRESTTQWWTLCRYLREQHVTMTTVMRVKRFMKHVMSGNQVKRADVILVDKLPEHLQMEIDFDVYGPCLEHHRFFSHYTEESPRCMKLICHGLETNFVGQGDTIFGEGEAASHMYWVKRGKLLYTQAGGAGEEHVLTGASWIAEPVLWVPWVHVGELFSYAASEVLMLPSEAFEEITMSQINAVLFAVEYAQQFMSKLAEMNNYHLTDLMQTRAEPISMLTPVFAKRRFKSSHLMDQKTKSNVFASTLFLRPADGESTSLCASLCNLLKRGR